MDAEPGHKPVKAGEGMSNAATIGNEKEKSVNEPRKTLFW